MQHVYRIMYPFKSVHNTTIGKQKETKQKKVTVPIRTESSTPIDCRFKIINIS